MGKSRRIVFQRVNYSDLDAKQKEIFNFQRASGVLAQFGFATYRLSDDWNGADFLAVHFDGETFLRVQLKSRVSFAKKYLGKDIWICFPSGDAVYLYPHDAMLDVAKGKTKICDSDSWKDRGGYTATGLPKGLQEEMEKYRLSIS